MTEVFLHVYDVANSESVKTNNAIVQLNKIFKDGIGLGGIFHSAIEVYGKQEWSFGYCESGSGVFNCPRTENPMYIYRESLSLGHTPLSPSKVTEILIKLRYEWQGPSYDLLSRNCNHFCNDFCTRLEVQKIPGWVNRFANAGETAVEVAETTMKRLRQAKTEVVSASKSAYRVLFGGASASAVSPDPGLVDGSDSSSNGSSSNGGGSGLRLSFMKTPSLFSKIGIGSASQSLNERGEGDESTSNRNGSVHVHSGGTYAPEQPSFFMKTPSLLSKIGIGSASPSLNGRGEGEESTSNRNGSVHVHSGGTYAPEQPPSC